MVRDDGDGGRFGACSACGGDGDDGRMVEGAGLRFVEVICVYVWIHEEECCGFCGVDGGTSSDADDEVGVEFAGGLCRFPDCVG